MPTSDQVYKERFLARLPVLPDNDCWEWEGARKPGGYGVFHYNGKDHPAHRISVILLKGVSIPRGMVVMHLCHNPPCCNPDHLKVGTQKENMQMSVQDGRMINCGNPGQPRKSIAELGHMKLQLCSDCAKPFDFDEIGFAVLSEYDYRDTEQEHRESCVFLCENCLEDCLPKDYI